MWLIIFRKMHSLGDTLAAVGQSLLDTEMSSYIIAGLGTEFDPLVTSVTTRVWKCLYFQKFSKANTVKDNSRERERERLRWKTGIFFMKRKITKLRFSSHWMDDLVVGRVFGPNLQESLRKKCNTPVWCLPKTLRCLSQKGREWYKEKKWLGAIFGWVFVCTFELCYPFLL